MKNKIKMLESYRVKKEVKSKNFGKENYKESIETDVIIYRMKKEEYIAIPLNITPKIGSSRYLSDILHATSEIDSNSNLFDIYFIDCENKKIISSKNKRIHENYELITNKHIGLRYNSNDVNYEEKTEEVLEKLITIVHPMNFRIIDLEKTISIKKTDLDFYINIALLTKTYETIINK